MKVAAGKVNAITGKGWRRPLAKTRQDYLVCPDQPWLDGINAGDGFIRQFVAMPLGMGYTVEGQVTGKEEFGGIQLLVFDPKPGLFREPEPEPVHALRFAPDAVMDVCCDSAPMGLAAGGRMRQKIYPDEYGYETWDPENYGRVYVHIVNSLMFREITGREPPATPVTARTYTEYGLPWFELYDEAKGDLEGSEILGKVKSVKDMDKKKGFGAQQDDTPVEVGDGQVVTLGAEGEPVRDGKW